MKMKYNEKGEEIPDTTRPELPLGFKRPESLAQQVARLVRSELVARAARESGHETFDEADDFAVGDDYDPRSPYEEVFDPTDAPEVVEEVKKRTRKPKPKSSVEDDKRRSPVDDESSRKPKKPKRSSASALAGSGGEDPQDE